MAQAVQGPYRDRPVGSDGAQRGKDGLALINPSLPLIGDRGLVVVGDDGTAIAKNGEGAKDGVDTGAGASPPLLPTPMHYGGQAARSVEGGVGGEGIQAPSVRVASPSRVCGGDKLSPPRAVGGANEVSIKRFTDEDRGNGSFSATAILPPSRLGRPRFMHGATSPIFGGGKAAGLCG